MNAIIKRLNLSLGAFFVLSVVVVSTFFWLRWSGPTRESISSEENSTVLIKFPEELSSTNLFFSPYPCFVLIDNMCLQKLSFSRSVLTISAYRPISPTLQDWTYIHGVLFFPKGEFFEYYLHKSHGEYVQAYESYTAFLQTFVTLSREVSVNPAVALQFLELFLQSPIDPENQASDFSEHEKIIAQVYAFLAQSSMATPRQKKTTSLQYSRFFLESAWGIIPESFFKSVFSLSGELEAQYIQSYAIRLPEDGDQAFSIQFSSIPVTVEQISQYPKNPIIHPFLLCRDDLGYACLMSTPGDIQCSRFIFVEPYCGSHIFNFAQYRN